MTGKNLKKKKGAKKERKYNAVPASRRGEESHTNPILFPKTLVNPKWLGAGKPWELALCQVKADKTVNSYCACHVWPHLRADRLFVWDATADTHTG